MYVQRRLIDESYSMLLRKRKINSHKISPERLTASPKVGQLAPNPSKIAYLYAPKLPT
jgi:hypothetical protein